MKDIIKNKYFLTYAILAAVTLAAALVSVLSVTMTNHMGSYNAFGMIAAYAKNGKDQGFISLMTPIVCFATFLAVLPSAVFALKGCITRKYTGTLPGLPLAALVLQIVWGVLFQSYLSIQGFDVFFDMSRSCVPGAGYWIMLALTAVLAVAIFVLKATVFREDVKALAEME